VTHASNPANSALLAQSWEISVCEKVRVRLVTPATVKRTVMPRRLPNADLRTREHLTEAEVEQLMGAARKNR
jgi:hypothetical protein